MTYEGIPELEAGFAAISWTKEPTKAQRPDQCEGGDHRYVRVVP
jgi:hypothetical protein